MRKYHDDLKTKSTRLCSELDGLIDQVKDLELESHRPHIEDNQYISRIRTLENKLDKATIKITRLKASARRVTRLNAKQIVKRLKETRIRFDNQLQAIERTLGTKQINYEELMLINSLLTNQGTSVVMRQLNRLCKI
jgi:coiled-coil domain-containing protein 151